VAKPRRPLGFAIERSANAWLPNGKAHYYREALEDAGGEIWLALLKPLWRAMLPTGSVVSAGSRLATAMRFLLGLESPPPPIFLEGYRGAWHH